MSDYCPIEDGAQCFCFLIWLLGVGLLPVVGLWAVPLAVVGFTLLEILHEFLEHENEDLQSKALLGSMDLL